MAVKVMVAPAIAKRAAANPEPRPVREAGPAPRPRRRRSSVYDADGNEVFITLMCLKCHKMRPLSQFGLRKMADGAIRNQPWCRTCRSAAGTKPAPRGSAESVDSAAAAGPLEGLVAGEAASARADAPAEARPQSTLASQVAAALAAGLGR
jgi:hypothetical protein